MHFLGHGIARQLFNLLNGDYTDSTGKGPFKFRLKNITLKDVGQLMEQSRQNLPEGFRGCWKDMFSSVRYRAVDWLDFLIYVVPTLVLDNLVDDQARAAVKALVTACTLTLQWCITEEDVQATER